MRNKKTNFILITMLPIIMITLIGLVNAVELTVCPIGCDYTNIQNAIDNASSGDTISVGAGTYNDEVPFDDHTATILINKSLTLLGAQAGVNPRNGRVGDESIINASGTNSAITIAVSGVTIDGFEIIGDDTGSFFGIWARVEGLNNITIQYNKIHNIVSYIPYEGWSPSGHTLAINLNAIGDSLTPMSEIVIDNNLIYDIGSEDELLVRVTNVLVNGVNSSGAVEGGGVIFSNNTIRDTITPTPDTRTEGFTVWHGADVLVTGNQFKDVQTAVYFWSGSFVPIVKSPENCKVTLNSFDMSADFGVKKVVEIDEIIDATNNWWGSAVPNTSKISDNVTYYPFCINTECTETIEDQITEFTGNSTTNFSNITDWTNVELILDNENGMINWTNPINLIGSTLLFDLGIEITHNKIIMNTELLPELNKPSKITFKNTGYDNIKQIFFWKDGKKDTTSTKTFIDGNVNVIVTGFSTYELKKFEHGDDITGTDLTGAVVDTGVKTIVGFNAIAGLLGIFLAVIIGLIIYTKLIKKK